MIFHIKYCWIELHQKNKFLCYEVVQYAYTASMHTQKITIRLHFMRGQKFSLIERPSFDTLLHDTTRYPVEISKNTHISVVHSSFNCTEGW